MCTASFQAFVLILESKVIFLKSGELAAWEFESSLYLESQQTNKREKRD